MPEEARWELAQQLVPYRQAHPHVRWTHPETWHLTLLFLGSVDRSRLPELERLNAEVAAQVGPYRVRADQGGGRAHRREGAAWLGLSEGAGRLIEVATLVAEGCPPTITGGPPPKRTPSAHLTVGRRADEQVVEALRTQVHGPLGVVWTIDRIHLVRSHLEPAGARYVTLHEATL